jgi:hypothetical protein
MSTFYDIKADIGPFLVAQHNDSVLREVYLRKSGENTCDVLYNPTVPEYQETALCQLEIGLITTATTGPQERMYTVTARMSRLGLLFKFEMTHSENVVNIIRCLLTGTDQLTQYAGQVTLELFAPSHTNTHTHGP